MKNILKNEFGISKGAQIGIAIGMIFFLFMSFFVYTKIYTTVEDRVSSLAVNGVTNISELNATSVANSLKNRQILLNTFAENLGRSESENIPVILRELNAYCENYEFYNMGILTPDNQLCLTNGKTIDVSSSEKYQEALHYGGNYISESFMPVDGGEYKVNLMSVPVYYDNELAYVITATVQSKYFISKMNISMLDDKGYTFLVNKLGDVVIYPAVYENESYLELMQYINSEPDILPTKGDDTVFTYNSENYYAHFESLGINDWYLMTCAKQEDIFSDVKLLMFSVLMGLFMLWVQLMLALGFILYLFYRSRTSIQKAVFYDSLLGIGSGELLRVYFEKLPYEKREALAFVIFDIDKFKEFNYVYGEACGDDLLKYIADTFMEVFPEDKLFRIVSDHFVALMECATRKEFIEKFDSLIARFNKDAEQGRIQPFDISAGVRKVNRGEPYRMIMSDALLARGTIKGIHLQQYAFYDADFRDKRMRYMELESDFNRALKEGEFKVYYQPKYDMATGEIIGSEALVRWVKADGTIISPAEFIPCFEASRQIILLDEVMLENVCKQMKAMKAEGIKVKKVSVNLSRVHLRNHGILGKIEAIIKDSEVDTKNLSFEITESALYEDSIPLTRIVDFLHGLGCKVDMDDYGVGVSSPTSLANNDFDMVKMDKSFIDGISDEKMAAVIRSTIRLAGELGMDVLAEGVEEKYQADILLSWGCKYAQGFYYSKPVPEEEFKKMLKENRKRL